MLNQRWKGGNPSERSGIFGYAEIDAGWLDLLLRGLTGKITRFRTVPLRALLTWARYIEPDVIGWADQVAGKYT